MTEQQLGIFTPEQQALLEQQLESKENAGAIKIQWSAAQDKRIWDMFTSLVCWALLAPTTVEQKSLQAGGYSADVARKHRTDVVIERFVRVFRWCKELREETEEAKSKEELQAAYKRLLGLSKDAQERLTNWEVCFVLMECSLAAPLGYDVTEEYMRAFAHCFGLEGYQAVTKENEYRPLRLEQIRGARHESKIAKKFPVLDEQEIAWIERFNQALKNRVEGKDTSLFPGMKVGVAETQP